MSRTNFLAPPLLYVVDDDADIRSAIQLYLGKHGFEVIGLPTADEMLSRLRRRRPDPARFPTSLLDPSAEIALPQCDGLCIDA